MPARRCPYCRAYSNFSQGNKVPAHRGGGAQLSLDSCQNCGKYVYFDATEDGSLVFDVYPKIEAEPDEELPDDVKLPLREAYRSVADQNWNSCVTMCRRAIDEATTLLGAQGATLFTKIEDLASKGRITPELQSWAHEGRLGGNLGAHGTETKKWANQQDAEEIIEFAKWFLRYLFVLPKQLALRRQQVSGDSSASQPRTSSSAP